jgi:IS5 family transposase
MHDTAQIRKTNLQKLVAGSENKSEFARRAGLSSAHLRQMVNVRAGTGDVLKPCGEKLARKIETALGLERGWLDSEHGDTSDRGPLTLLAGEQPAVASATPSAPTPADPELVNTVGLTPLQRAVVDALLKVCRNGELSDRECIDLLDLWKEKLN